jgi:nucleoside-diphosphate-sugar epimerase
LSRIVVIGGAGYLGTILAEELLQSDHSVDIFDALRFGRRPIENLGDHPNQRLIEGDIRDVSAISSAVRGADGVILLASLVGEPACDLDPSETDEINFVATKMVAEACRYYEVPRFIFASTDSIYGIREGVMTEDSEKNPISQYARLKLRSEEEILSLATDDFRPTVLRMSTIYGCSHRTRFDLVVNILSLRAWATGKITIHGGKQWRPFVHVRDAAKSYRMAIEAPVDKVSGEVFNVGSNDQNHQIGELGDLVRQVYQDVEIETIPQDPDLRDYYVNCDKISETLGYETTMSVVDGIREIRDWLESKRIADPEAAWRYNVPR